MRRASPVTFVVLAFASAGGLYAYWSREAPPPRPDFKFEVDVESDPKIPLAGASVILGGEELAKTDATGKAIVGLQGNDGETRDLFVRCPSDYTSPTAPVLVNLIRLAEDGRPMSKLVRCPPEKRTVVIAIRAENGANLPVMYLGQERTRTDSSGATSFHVTAKPGELIQFVLDTSDESHSTLRPESPTLSVLVDDRDDVLLVDQPFQRQPTRVRMVPAARPHPPPTGPTLL